LLPHRIEQEAVPDHLEEDSAAEIPLANQSRYRWGDGVSVTFSLLLLLRIDDKGDAAASDEREAVPDHLEEDSAAEIPLTNQG